MMPHLHSNNQISSFEELSKLAVLPALRILSLQGNSDLEASPTYRMEVIGRLKHLQRLDKDVISPEERDDADLHYEALMRDRNAANAGGADDAADAQ
jgi:hypothetical protein